MSLRQVGVSLTMEERATLKKIADSMDMSISGLSATWIREHIAEWEKENKKVVAKSVFANLGKKRA
jgi:hemerythrin